MPPGQEQVAIIVDVSESITGIVLHAHRLQYKSATSQSNPSISTGRKVLSILQNHYVERERLYTSKVLLELIYVGLGRGLVVNMSYVPSET